MNINEAFPSNYIKASDLQGRQVSLKMDRAEYEMIGNDKKLVLYFQGREKGMVLNKTNANNISQLYGQDTDDWNGQDIVLFEAMVDFQGKTVPAIRVRGPSRAAQPKKPAPAADQSSDMNDGIPF
jgi:arabinogalactan endo-1,4-beta-galactosidase